MPRWLPWVKNWKPIGFSPWTGAGLRPIGSARENHFKSCRNRVLLFLTSITSTPRAIGRRPAQHPPALRLDERSRSSQRVNIQLTAASWLNSDFRPSKLYSLTSHLASFLLTHHAYLITRSALASTLGGIVRPICLAVFKLITNSNLVGCSTGNSAGFAPLRILST
jgi:hypothetical protein